MISLKYFSRDFIYLTNFSPMYNFYTPNDVSFDIEMKQWTKMIESSTTKLYMKYHSVADHQLEIRYLLNTSNACKVD